MRIGSMPESEEGYRKLCDMVCNLLQAVKNYQAEDGMWYQVVDKAGWEGNWPTSVNDLHGVGSFLLMCAETEQVL